jgi:hypothetical protein
MRMIRGAFWSFMLAVGVVLISVAASTASAQTGGRQSNPCETAPSLLRFFPGGPTTNGLTPEDLGAVVYDSDQGVCWLADANLAGNPLVRFLLGVSGINSDGTMDYPTAVKWVAALNRVKFLGHENWQLPDNPLDDNSCSSFNNGGFGVGCTADALGYLYNFGLGRTFPASVVSHFINTVGIIHNLQPAQYWTSETAPGDSGESTYSFVTDLNYANTTRFNYLHVLPMVAGPIGPAPYCPPNFSGLVRYPNGPAANLAVYDCGTGNTWTADANLAAFTDFGIGARTIITIPRDNPNNGPPVQAPLISEDGSMLFGTAWKFKNDGTGEPDGWLKAMNQQSYAGSANWTLPATNDLVTLFHDLRLTVGDPRLEVFGSNGPFFNLQPSFYWACEVDNSAAGFVFNVRLPCEYNTAPAINRNGVPLMYSYNFDEGFEGTDLAGPAGPPDTPGVPNNNENKQFFVMIYYPAPDASH